MDTLPSKLYKYFAPDRSGIFNDWLIRFTQHSALNDPFEMRPHISDFGTAEDNFSSAAERSEKHARQNYKELVKQYGSRISEADFLARVEKNSSTSIHKATATIPKLIPEMARKIDETLNNDIGALSLCTHPANLLMWAHYGNSHRGFVIEFDTASPFFIQERPPKHVEANEEDTAQFAEEYGRLRVVSYSNERPTTVVTEMSFDLLLTKGLDWKYENEWRMLMPLKYADVKTDKPDKSNHPVYLFKIPPKAVTKIILGCAADSKLVAHALTLKSKVDTQHIVIERAQVDERHFQLNFENVE